MASIVTYSLVNLCLRCARTNRWVLFHELLLMALMVSIAACTEFGFRFENTFVTMTAVNTGLMVVMAPRSVVEVRRFAFVMDKL